MFTVRNYPSEENFDVAKFINFVGDSYDFINSPLLNHLKTLPVTRYYTVKNGYNELDQISQEAYSSPFFTFYIMYYNDLQSEVVPEDTTLRLFSLTDLNILYQNISKGLF